MSEAAPLACWRYLTLLGLAMLLLPAPNAASCQRSIDYMTEREAEIVREAQAIDLRVKVLMKIADRRLIAAENPDAAQNKKDEETWGRVPTGSRTQLLTQYSQAVDEAVINIEDSYARSPKNPSLRKAVTAFREATDKQIPRLDALKSKLAGEGELQAFERAMETVKQANEDARENERENPTDTKGGKPKP